MTAECLRKSGEAKADETSRQRNGEPSQIFLIRTAKVEDEDLISKLHEAEVEFGGVIPFTLSRLTPILIPLGIIVLIFFLLSRRMNNMSGRQFNVGKSKARLVGEKDTGVSFEDVAGCDESKTELEEVVDFLKHPDRYRKLNHLFRAECCWSGHPAPEKRCWQKLSLAKPTFTSFN